MSYPEEGTFLDPRGSDDPRSIATVAWFKRNFPSDWNERLDRNRRISEQVQAMLAPMRDKK